jgi:signal transduction histidine kinase
MQVDISYITTSIFIVCVIIIFIVILLILFVVLYRKSHNVFLKEKELMNAQFSKALLQSQIEVQEATFSTLGKELHDNIGQLLSTAKMLLGITEINLTNPPDTLITANATVGKAISELRSLSKSLSKEWLEKFDLIENLATEVNRINSADAVKLYLTHPDKLSLEADKQIILFRIIQEAIQNAIKHSSAKNIYISITQHDNVLATTVKDDGSGFSMENMSDGVGIINMKHRAKLLGGTVEWLSSDEGSTVNITLPVKQNEP